MKTTFAASSFSELKELLIPTYKIERPSIEVRLQFSEEENQLLMYEYDDHRKVIVLSNNIKAEDLSDSLTGKARLLCIEALETQSPAAYINAFGSQTHKLPQALSPVAH